MNSRALRPGLVLFLLCLVSAGHCRPAEPDRTYHILVVNSRQQGIPWTYSMMASLEATLLKAKADVELQIDYMHTARFIPGKGYFEKRSAVYAYEFHKYKFDVIISVGEDSLRYMRQFGGRMFPNTPVIFCGVSMASAARAVRLPNYSGVASDWNAKRNIELIARLCPWAREVVFVHDDTSEGRAISRDAQAMAREFPALKFTFATDMTMRDLLAVIRRVPHDAVVVMLPFTIDRSGDYYPADVAVSMVASASPVPTFGLWSFEIEDNLTGGLVLDEHEYGRQVAKAALRVATGENVKAVALHRAGATRYVFDYRKLREAGIPVSRLPKGSVLVRQPSNIWVEHRGIVLGTVGVFLALLGVVAAVAAVNARRRRAVEERLRLERETNAQKRWFYRETILCVTQGKLEMCEPAELQPYIDSAEVQSPLRDAQDIPVARSRVREYVARFGLDEEQLSVFMIAVGEALNNALKHGGAGQVFAGMRMDEVWAAVCDKGHGIDSLILPRVVLQRGFSTKVSMGMGYTIMLDSTDRLLLATGEQGTTVVLIKRLHEPAQNTFLDRDYDGWDSL